MEIDYKDHGKKPYIINIEDCHHRKKMIITGRPFWTGRKLQVTVMSIQPGDDIGFWKCTKALTHLKSVLKRRKKACVKWGLLKITYMFHPKSEMDDGTPYLFRRTILAPHRKTPVISRSDWYTIYAGPRSP